MADVSLTQFLSSHVRHQAGDQVLNDRRLTNDERPSIDDAYRQSFDRRPSIDERNDGGAILCPYFRKSFPFLTNLSS